MEGKGFLNGTQTKLKFVPEQDTDFIFCTVGEEEGFLGSAGVLLLFLALILRLIHLSERQPFRFGRVYGYCVLSIFLFHVFINVGMVLGLTPVIGIPLPFFSYGGSSLWGFTILLFIFLRIDASRNLDQVVNLFLGHYHADIRYPGQYFSFHVMTYRDRQRVSFVQMDGVNGKRELIVADALSMHIAFLVNQFAV